MIIKEDFIIIKKGTHIGLYDKNTLKWVKWVSKKDFETLKK